LSSDYWNFLPAQPLREERRGPASLIEKSLNKHQDLAFAIFYCEKGKKPEAKGSTAKPFFLLLLLLYEDLFR
jgi:hypothetical protein